MLKRILSVATFWVALSAGCQYSAVREDGLPSAGRIESLKELCEQGRAVPCYTLGFIYEHGQGVTESGISSKAYYRQACKLGLKEACKDPNAKPPGPPLIAALSEEEQNLVAACDRGQSSSCEELSDRGVRHLKEENDVKLAAALWAHACKQKVGAACFNLGITLEKDDPKFAAQAFNKACEHGSGSGCLRIAKLLAQSDDAKALTMALQFYDKACKAGETEGCSVVAAFMQRICDTENHGDACAAYAVLLLEGKGVKADFSKGHQYARKACRLGSQSGCKLEESTP